MKTTTIAAGLMLALSLSACATPQRQASMPARLPSGEPVLTIYHLEGRRSERLVWLCEELGLPYTLKYKRGDLANSMQAIRDISPLMPVAPTVQYNGQVVVESGAIIEMLLDRHGGGKLKPAITSPDYPYYLQWMHFAEGSLASRVIADYRVEMIRRSTTPARLVDAEDTLRFAEDFLGRNAYFGGKAFSAADIMMLFPLNFATSTRVIDIKDFPRLADWRSRMEARPAYKRMLAAARPDGMIGSLPPLAGPPPAR